MSNKEIASGPDIEEDIPMRKAQLRQALVRFYELYNPAQLAESLLDEVVGKYFGKEQQLLARLQKRYGAMPGVPYIAQLRKPQDTKEQPLPTSSAAVQPPPRITDRDRRDITSPHFDAYLALARGAILPFPDVLPRDNLSKCRDMLPATHAEYVPPPRKLQAAQSLPSKKQPEEAELIETIATSLDKGPYSLLCRCFREKRRVRVMIRRIDGVRGVVTGYLKAFDRHMNMVLAEADEVFMLPPPSPRKAVEGPRPPEQQRYRGKRAGRKRRRSDANGSVGAVVAPAGGSGDHAQGICQEDGGPRQQEDEQGGAKSAVRRRSLRQVLIRGDNVIIVWEGQARFKTHVLPIS